MTTDEAIHIDLDRDERRLMILALNEYGGLAKRGSELLPPAVGTSNAEDWIACYTRLRDIINIQGPLIDLDWARALFLVEASFGSQLVGTGWEWEIGQSSEKHVLVLRSLQDKIRTDERSRLLREKTAFPASNKVGTVDGSDGQTAATDPVELDDDERSLMSRTLGAYAKSPQRGFDLLAPMAGQPTFENWASHTAKLHSAVTDNRQLHDLDWARALFLTEIGFTSVIAGFGSQFKGADARGIGTLRSLQRTIGNVVRRQLFRDNATYPWIRYDD
ncbi:hypothetical protein [Mycolicibacterium sp. 120270]|uniref:hypothetical protein n=1 Tax=Mycolicibacterium sp. 120270 TaxID=3090600 RepID=UPI00299E8F41|nr:hypothetical protein [Mycolicibacterium sp. 120270]MDX1882106.1 hypothetical protein [Mycolicibacterium sp. 120270]